jgi:hypothetical protein
LGRLTRLRRSEIEGRFRAFQKLMRFDADDGNRD